MFKDEILKKYRYKSETHAHTFPVSACSRLDSENFSKHIEARNIDAVVITNHFTPNFLNDFDSAQSCAEFYLSDYIAVKERLKGKVNVILGMEIRFTENINDYLVYGINEEDIVRSYTYLDKGIDAFYKDFKSDKRVILQAHPFRDNMTQINPKSIDGIEVFNMHNGQNSRISDAAQYAEENGFIIGGGTDLHYPYQNGSYALLSDYEPKDSYDIADIYKSGNYAFMLGSSIIIPDKL